jgi:hypothetical protein
VKGLITAVTPLGPGQDSFLGDFQLAGFNWRVSIGRHDIATGVPRAAIGSALISWRTKSEQLL